MSETLDELKTKLKRYEEKLAYKMKGYHGISHENALSELKHTEVMVLKDMVRQLEEQIFKLEHPEANKI